MAWYQFVGQNATGQAVKGQVDVDSELALHHRLQSAGIMALSVKKLNWLKVALIHARKIVSYCVRVKKSDLASFYYQLANLLEVDIPLKNALFMIASHTRHLRLSRIVHDMIAMLSQGKSFAEALRKNENVFSEVTVNLLANAQSQRELIAILRYCDQASSRLSFFKRALLMAMPQCSLMIVFFMLLLFLRERYLADFKYALFVFRQSEPVIIRVFEFMTGLLTQHILKTFFFAVAGCLLVKWLLFFFQKWRYGYHAVLCYFPFISGVVLALERERLSLLYSVLLADGTSIQKCVQSSIPVVHNLFFRRKVQAMYDVLRQGGDFADALRFFDIFNSAEVQMITIGSLSRSLAKAFERIYSLSCILLERRLLLLLELTRLAFYVLNTLLLFFTIFVAETLFYYPGSV